MYIVAIEQVYPGGYRKVSSYTEYQHHQTALVAYLGAIPPEIYATVIKSNFTELPAVAIHTNTKEKRSKVKLVKYIFCTEEQYEDVQGVLTNETHFNN